MRYIRFGVEAGLLSIACFSLGYSAYVLDVQRNSYAEAAAIYPSVQMQTAGRRSQDAYSRNSVSGLRSRLAVADAVGRILGRVKIDALGLDVPIVAGVDTDSLLMGLGHIEGTAYPGGLGTVGLAGHRDTYLRPIEHVTAGMDVRVTDRTGMYHYQVDRTEIVSPEQVSVLRIRSQPELVLITCYPFRYIGPAPKRFVVHAHLVSVTPELP